PGGGVRIRQPGSAQPLLYRADGRGRAPRGTASRSAEGAGPLRPLPAAFAPGVATALDLDPLSLRRDAGSGRRGAVALAGGSRFDHLAAALVPGSGAALGRRDDRARDRESLGPGRQARALTVHAGDRDPAR